ncbi:MAG: hypothetical protein II248_05515 [Paludibacteraceae bacterium]|nr:hypothetical protein [Paludibacteraceae bacterium]
MNRFKISLVVLALALPMFATLAKADVQSDRFEFGVNAGVGFYVGQKDPLGTGVVSRIQAYDVLGFGHKSDLGWPGIETFGFSFGYRFDTYWHLKAQATRQRVCYAEYLNNDYQTRNIYYNAMWHMDVMAEYNLLSYGMKESGSGAIQKVVPYIGFGLGVTVYNKESHLRKVYAVDGPMNNFGSKGCIYTCYPRVGMQQVYDKNLNLSWKPAETACALYVPLAVGVKWRINPNVQLKGTFQYQLYFSGNKPGGLNSNLEGGAYSQDKIDALVHNLDIPAHKNTFEGRPTFDQLNKQIVGANHDCMFSVSAIFNLGRWYEDRLITY